MQPFDTAVFGPFKSNWQEPIISAFKKLVKSLPRTLSMQYSRKLNSLVPANIIGGCKNVFSQKE